MMHLISLQKVVRLSWWLVWWCVLSEQDHVAAADGRRGHGWDGIWHWATAAAVSWQDERQTRRRWCCSRRHWDECWQGESCNYIHVVLWSLLKFFTCDNILKSFPKVYVSIIYFHYHVAIVRPRITTHAFPVQPLTPETFHPFTFFFARFMSITCL